MRKKGHRYDPGLEFLQKRVLAEIPNGFVNIPVNHIPWIGKGYATKDTPSHQQVRVSTINIFLFDGVLPDENGRLVGASKIIRQDVRPMARGNPMYHYIGLEVYPLSQGSKQNLTEICLYNQPSEEAMSLMTFTQLHGPDSHGRCIFVL